MTRYAEDIVYLFAVRIYVEIEYAFVVGVYRHLEDAASLGAHQNGVGGFVG